MFKNTAKSFILLVFLVSPFVISCAMPPDNGPEEGGEMSEEVEVMEEMEEEPPAG